MSKITTKDEFQRLLKMNKTGYLEYSCSQCGKNARYNTPYIDKDGNIWCSQCSHKSTVMMQGVDQHTLEIDKSPRFPNEKGKDGTREEFTKKGAVVWRENGQLSVAWLKEGSQGVPIHHDEQKMDPEVFLDKILKEQADGYYRCTTCKKTFKGEPAGYPLFAGICCVDCMQKHREMLEKERKTGRVCSFCHEPYGNCCC